MQRQLYQQEYNLKQPSLGESSEAGVRFGFSPANASKALLPALPVFTVITSYYLASFLAQDVVGFWLPRIGVSLSRGAKEYDIWSDPQAQGLPPHKFYAKYIYEKTKRLNWDNLKEESGREFCTGPAMLLIPTFAYGGIKAFSAGKDAMKLGLGDMRDYKQTLQHHFNAHGGSLQTTADVGEQLKTLFNEMLDNPVFREAGGHTLEVSADFRKKFPNLAVESLPNTLNQAKAIWTQHMGERFVKEAGLEKGPWFHIKEEYRWAWSIIKSPYTLSKKGLQKIGLLAEKPAEHITQMNAEAAEALLADYIKQVQRKPEVLERIVETELKQQLPQMASVLEEAGLKLEEALQKSVKDLESLSPALRQKAETLRNTHFYGVDEISIQLLQHGKEGKSVIRKSMSEFFEQTHHVGAWMEELYRNRAEAGAKGLGHLVEKMYNRMAISKAALAIGLTAAGCGYLFWLSHVVQSSDRYPANRLLQFDNNLSPDAQAKLSVHHLPITANSPVSQTFPSKASEGTENPLTGMANTADIPVASTAFPSSQVSEAELMDALITSLLRNEPLSQVLNEVSPPPALPGSLPPNPSWQESMQPSWKSDSAFAQVAPRTESSLQFPRPMPAEFVIGGGMQNGKAAMTSGNPVPPASTHSQLDLTSPSQSYVSSKQAGVRYVYRPNPSGVPDRNLFTSLPSQSGPAAGYHAPSINAGPWGGRV